MLTDYRININNVYKDKTLIRLVPDSGITGISEVYNITGNNKLLMTCDCENTEGIVKGSSVISINTLSLNYQGTDYEKYDNVFIFTNEFKVSGITNDGIISFLIDKFYNLPCSAIRSISLDNKEYLYLYTEENHYFDIEDNITLYFKYNTNNGDSDRIVTCKGFSFVTPWSLRIKLTDFFNEEGCQDVYEFLFNSREFVDGDANLHDVAIMRDNFLFNTKTTYEIYKNTIITKIFFTLNKTFANDIHQEYKLQNEFVNDEKAKSINRIIDMEKDVYHPVLCVGNDIKNINRIKFNLHFRHHNGDNWSVGEDDYWNGTYVDTDNKIKFMGNSFEPLSEKPFFSNTDRSSQSDNLSYLGFNNNDVIYRRNKLSKSFLRLSFYDSMNPSNQNLISYSTIFTDSGRLFTKHVKNLYVEPFCFFSENVVRNLKGLKVNREPQFHVDGDIEEHRLSSQFSVSDKNTSLSSSEGFYLYFWKDNEEGIIPNDIFMKIEYNHAGYGRTIPFMMPFWDYNKWGKQGIKTFEEIVDDWNNIPNSDKRYDIKQYYKYLYVRLKCRYDAITQRHIYYLDDNIYGKDSLEKHVDNGTLTINLYEAKISS